MCVVMDNKKLVTVLEDKAFLAELIELKDNDAVQAALKAKGMELTNELLEQISGGFGSYYSSAAIANAENNDNNITVYDTGASGKW